MSRLCKCALSLVVLLYVIIQVKCNARKSYTAAVYEHAVFTLPLAEIENKTVALSVMKQNLQVYETATAEAKKKGAEIIVFPEDGLYGFEFTREVFHYFTEDIPNPETQPGWNPCKDQHPGDPTNTPVQYWLSCMALNNSIYLVANVGDVKYCNVKSDKLCPADGRYQYNTNVVYDPEGRLVARYHKQNLFMGEKLKYNQPHQCEYTTFTTPFGKFGTFTCFDVLFREPPISLVENYGVDNVVFPTAWMDVLPLFASVEFHQAWAMGMGVNFLSANTHRASLRMHGSGIFTPQGAVVYTHDTTTEQGRLLVAKVPILKRTPIKSTYRPYKNMPLPTDHEAQTAIKFQAEVFSDLFDFVTLPKPSGSLTICQKAVCCQLNYTFEDSHSGGLYALGAFDGLHTREGQYYLQICTLLSCANSSTDSCGQPTNIAKSRFKNLSLSGIFNTKYIFPEFLTTDGTGHDLANGQWLYDDGMIKVNNTTVKPLLSATLFGRWYQRDNDFYLTGASARKSPMVLALNLVLYNVLFNLLY
ncbi:pantetheinase [Lingula anatina]|uniref:Pantetheinase n=1 Tax=Lingula anatina TaxID=7574 RepID=A0A1S3H953_LINAN|nr:pantetheinase [Lingula anatina]|eukprot:XP_013382532.2 pantetheinase [Lingula anatina]